MKNIIAGAGLLALMASAPVAAEQVTESRAWTESFTVSTATPSLVISNIWGNVRVRPGPSGQITVTFDERRSAPNAELFERSLNLLPLNVDADTSGVSIIVGNQAREWRHRDPCPDCRAEFQFEILVPPGTLLDVGTVTDGQIDVAGIAGKVSASNVNGPITVSEIKECDLLESVNGEVVLSFTTAPGRDCSIETINGDITLHMPDGSGLDVALDLFNGHVVTEFQVDPYSIPAEVEHVRTGDRHHYRIQQSAGLRLEGGGPTFSISSLNGDIRIQKNQ